MPGLGKGPTIIWCEPWEIQPEHSCRKDIEEEITKLINADYKVITSDEVGLGIVPLDRKVREWREATGRALCRIAAEADEVYRVSCGIGMKIK